MWASNDVKTKKDVNEKRPEKGRERGIFTTTTTTTMTMRKEKKKTLHINTEQNKNQKHIIETSKQRSDLYQKPATAPAASAAATTSWQSTQTKKSV